MPGVEEFVNLLATTPAGALDQYLVKDHSLSLDANSFSVEEKECVQRHVVFDSIQPNRISMRAADQGEPTRRTLLSALGERSLSKADLGGAGPAFFSTSQLTGCRFTIQYPAAPR